MYRCEVCWSNVQVSELRERTAMMFQAAGSLKVHAQLHMPQQGNNLMHEIQL